MTDINLHLVEHYYAGYYGVAYMVFFEEVLRWCCLIRSVKVQVQVALSIKHTLYGTKHVNWLITYCRPPSYLVLLLQSFRTIKVIRIDSTWVSRETLRNSSSNLKAFRISPPPILQSFACSRPIAKSHNAAGKGDRDHV